MTLASGWAERKIRKFFFYVRESNRFQIISAVDLIINYNERMPDKPPVALIENVWTDDLFRRRGFAERLMRDAIATAKRHGCTHMYLTSNKSRKAARKLYKKLDFKKATDGFVLELCS